MKKLFIVFILFILIISCKSKENSNTPTSPVTPPSTIFPKSTIPQNVGTLGFSPSKSMDINIKVASANNVYVSYADLDNFEVYLMKFNGASWDTLANSLVGNAELDSLTLDKNGIPYLSYFDDTAGIKKIKVIKYESGSLQDIITGMPVTGYIDSHASITFINDVLHLTYINKTSPQHTYVYLLQSGVWTAVGTQPAFSILPYEPSIKSYGNIPYIAFEEKNATGRVIVAKYNGSSWEQLGTGGFASDVLSEYINLEFSPSGTPYICYRDSTLGGTEDIKVRKYNGSTWQDVGTSVSITDARYPSLGFLPNSETPYIFYTEVTGIGGVVHAGNAILKKFNGTDWVKVTDSIISDNARYTTMAISSSTIYLAFTDYANGQKVTVKKIE